MSYQLYIVITLQFCIVFAANEGLHSSTPDIDYVQIEGLVANPPGINREEFFTACRVHVDGGQQIAFLRCVK